ncbi:hypothetical protein AK812_SmicGene45513 [Symbiodinium microadriaticum]|uniref:Uncharacterized protein n=1 Tax=Symbiodinium microadriaticum TaxID=2951 RepID=A0A1Q9BVZ2_SYMMI|nr:hypothetical protein AK812_SmicGene45513 [Symbiodinium microadriaticum]
MQVDGFALLALQHHIALPEVLRSAKADVHLAKMVNCYAPHQRVRPIPTILHCPSLGLLGHAFQGSAPHSNHLDQVFAVHAHLDALRTSLHSELVSAYGRSGSIVERRESASLPLSFVIFLERRTWNTTLSAQQRIIAGSFALHLCISSVFRCIVVSSWTPLHHRRVSLQATAMLHPNFTPDFILARSEGVVLLRQLFSICYAQTQPSSRPEADLLGVHSLKVTLLSFGRQLLIREDLQRQQGHHRSSLAGMSDLYGRDDVAAPLEFQRQVVAAVLEGFRPRRPGFRGGLPPTADIEVALPCVPGASDMPPVGSNPVPDAEHDTSSDSEVEDERAASPIPLPPSTQELPEAVTEALSMTLEPLPQDASSSSGAADDWTDVRGQADEFFFLLNGVSHIAHKAERPLGCAPVLMALSTSSSSESASTSFSSEIELFVEAPAADWQPAVRIRPRHFHEARLLHLLIMSTRTERAILPREEITIWEVPDTFGYNGLPVS